MSVARATDWRRGKCCPLGFDCSRIGQGHVCFLFTTDEERDVAEDVFATHFNQGTLAAVLKSGEIAEASTLGQLVLSYDEASAASAAVADVSSWSVGKLKAELDLRF